MKHKRLLTISELAEITATKKSYWYEKSRRNMIPGMLRVGKFIRIDLQEFCAATRVSQAGSR